MQRWILAIAIIVVGVSLASSPARAQVICANFWADHSGTYGDECGVTLTPASPPQASAHGVTGFAVANAFAYAYNSDQQVVRFDLQLVGIDPGEEVRVRIDGAFHPIQPQQIIRNPDVTPQRVALVGGALRSNGADGSAYIEIIAIGARSMRVGVTGGSVIVYPVVNTACQCGNGNKHFNELCDDGDTMNGDGCSAACEIESGWTCDGNPSVCVAPDAPPAPDASPVIDAAPPGPDAGHPGDDSGDGGGGCSAGGQGALGAALALLVTALAPLRSRRSPRRASAP